MKFALPHQIMAQGFTFPGPAHYISPIFGVYTPATDMTAGIMTYQGTICEQFELNFYRCTEAFGKLFTLSYFLDSY